jgi:hypothetical protein
MRSLPPFDFLIVPPPDHDPLKAENGPGSLRASPGPTVKSSNPAITATLNEHNAWNRNAITSAPCSSDATVARPHPDCLTSKPAPQQSLGHQFL